MPGSRSDARRATIEVQPVPMTCGLSAAAAACSPSPAPPMAMGCSRTVAPLGGVKRKLSSPGTAKLMSVNDTSIAFDGSAPRGYTWTPSGTLYWPSIAMCTAPTRDPAARGTSTSS